MCGEEISDSASVQFLGVHLDATLSWHAHCEQLASKLNSYCYLFRSIRSILTIDEMMILYYSHVESRISYGICLWGHSPAARSVFICQKKILRAIFGMRSDASCRSSFFSRSILTLPALYIYCICVYIYRHETTFFKNSEYHSFNTRSNDNLRPPFRRLNIGQQAPNVLGINIYNKLSGELKLLGTLK